MNDKKAPVGPLDVTQWLADVKAGKKVPRTASETVFLAPELADEYDALVDKYNALVEADAAAAKAEQSLADGPDEHAAELDALEAQMDELWAESEAQKATFTFRSYQSGDLTAIQEQMKAAGVSDQESLVRFSFARYCTGMEMGGTSTTLTPDDVAAIIPVIGYVQFEKLCQTYQLLVFGAPSAPKSRRPLRSRGTETL